VEPAEYEGDLAEFPARRSGRWSESAAKVGAGTRQVALIFGGSDQSLLLEWLCRCAGAVPVRLPDSAAFAARMRTAAARIAAALEIDIQRAPRHKVSQVLIRRESVRTESGSRRWLPGATVLQFGGVENSTADLRGAKHGRISTRRLNRTRHQFAGAFVKICFRNTGHSDPADTL